MRWRYASISVLIVSLTFLGAFGSQCPLVAGSSSQLLNGIFVIPCPGSQTWSFDLCASYEYALTVALASVGPAIISLVVRDPARTSYTLVETTFVQQEEGNAYAMRFISTQNGTYQFTLNLENGPSEAVSVQFSITDAGALEGAHDSPSYIPVYASAQAINWTNSTWELNIPLLCNTTYFLDFALGDPSEVNASAFLSATIEAPGVPSVAVLLGAPVPWGNPSPAGQLLQWGSGWFGVATTGTYTIKFTTQLPQWGNPVIIATTFAQLNASASQCTPSPFWWSLQDSTLQQNASDLQPLLNFTFPQIFQNSSLFGNITWSGNASGSQDGSLNKLAFDPQGTEFAAGISVTGTAIGVIAMGATRRKSHGQAGSGEVRREDLSRSWGD